jgi:hypothetical protein
VTAFLFRDAKHVVRRKKAGAGCCGRTIEAKMFRGQTQSIRGRSGETIPEIDGADGDNDRSRFAATGENGVGLSLDAWRKVRRLGPQRRFEVTTPSSAKRPRISLEGSSKNSAPS